MTAAEFDGLLLRYGANLQNWPAALRGSAQALLAVDPVASGLLQEMRAIDAALVAIAADAPEKVPSSETAIVAHVRARRQGKKFNPSEWAAIFYYGLGCGAGSALALFVASLEPAPMISLLLPL